MFTLEDLETFVAIVENQSLKDAATQLGVTPTLVSRRLKSLEGRLDAELITRSTRSQSITSLGQQFYERGKRLLSDASDLAESVSENQKHPSGNLTISAPNVFGAERLAPVLGSFLKRFPQIDLDLQFTDKRVDIIDKGFDAVFRVGALNDSELIARPLEAYQMVVCASPSYLEQHSTPIHPLDLKRHHGLEFSVASARPWRFTHEGKDVQVRLKRKLVANSGYALRQMALAGLGLIMQPSILVEDDLRNGRLVSVLESYIPEGRQMHLVYSKNRFGSPRLNVFIEHILKTLR